MGRLVLAKYCNRENSRVIFDSYLEKMSGFKHSCRLKILLSLKLLSPNISQGFLLPDLNTSSPIFADFVIF